MERHAGNVLALACATGLFGMGLMHSAWALQEGQGGATENTYGGTGGDSNSGGGGGGTAYNGNPGFNGAGGVGGAGTNASPFNGGFFGAVGLLASVDSVVSSDATGGLGSDGTQQSNAGGGGGGGGGDGVYALAGVSVTVNSGVKVHGGNGGHGAKFGGNAPFYSGGGGGGGHGVAFKGTGGVLINNGKIYGGSGMLSDNSNDKYGGGGGGGHGVVGTGITIANSGQITEGTGGFGKSNSSGRHGASIALTGGVNHLNLLSGSQVTGDIEIADNTTLVAYAQSDGQYLNGSSNIVLDGAGSILRCNATPASLVIGGRLYGPGKLQVGTPGGGGSSVTVPNLNTAFTGDTTVYSGTLSVNGFGLLAGVTIAGGGTLGGDGKVGAITLESGGAIAPGNSNRLLTGGSLAWNGGGGLNFHLGATNGTGSTDRVVLSGALAKGDAGPYVFHFSDGVGGPPVAGVVYTLVTFGSYSGFTAADFTFDYAGANAGLDGTFALNATSLTFTPTSTKATSTTLLATPCMTTFVENQPFSLDAATTGASPSGSITFGDGVGTLCSNVALSAGAASCTTTDVLTVPNGDTQAIYNLTASYGGDSNNKSSASAPIMVKVLTPDDVPFRNGFEPALENCPIQ